MHPREPLNDAAVILLFSLLAGSLDLSLSHIHLWNDPWIFCFSFKAIYDRLLTTLEQFHKRLENLVMEGSADIMKMKTNF